jgi:hypothetical protein
LIADPSIAVPPIAVPPIAVPVMAASAPHQRSIDDQQRI